MAQTPRAVWICYVDESGDEYAGLSGQNNFSLLGLLVRSPQAHGLLAGFVDLKARSFQQLRNPNLRFSDLIAFEVKGSRLRRGIRRGGARQRAAMVFLNRCIDLLEESGVALVVHSISISANEPLPRRIYADSVLRMLEVAAGFARRENASVLTVLDSRTQSKNVPTVHQIADALQSRLLSSEDLLEIPVFGHSTSHGLLQIADVLVSAVVALKPTQAAPQLNGYDASAMAEIDRLRARVANLEVR